MAPMTHGAHQQGATSNGLIGQFLALLRLLIEVFAKTYAEERTRIRNLKGCPTPDNWLAHWPALREIEIRLHGLTLSGIDQLRTRGGIDLLTLTCIADPGFDPQHPHTFEDLRARYEAVATFMADPIPIIRRAAERAAAPTVLRFAQSTSPVPAGRRRKATCARSTSRFPPPCEARGRWIGASSRRDGGGSHVRQSVACACAHARAPPRSTCLESVTRLAA
jgi:hypothetical protein